MDMHVYRIVGLINFRRSDFDCTVKFSGVFYSKERFVEPIFDRPNQITVEDIICQMGPLNYPRMYGNIQGVLLDTFYFLETEDCSADIAAQRLKNPASLSFIRMY